MSQTERTTEPAAQHVGPDARVAREREFWDDHAEFEWMAEESRHDVVAMLPAIQGDVLELCIGSGMLTGYLPPTFRSYTGFDLSRTLLNAVRSRVPGLRLVQGDASTACFRPESFDAVLVFAGLHHLPDYPAAVRQAYAALRPGGRFVCLEPSRDAWYRRPMEYLRDFIGIYSEDEVFLESRAVTETLARAGFSDVHTDFLTPRFSKTFLTPRNRLLAGMLYAGAALGTGRLTQSFFLMSARKPPSTVPA